MHYFCLAVCTLYVLLYDVDNNNNNIAESTAATGIMEKFNVKWSEIQRVIGTVMFVDCRENGQTSWTNVCMRRISQVLWHFTTTKDNNLTAERRIVYFIVCQTDSSDFRILL